MSRRHLVVGTAGHIDHGKSALIEALTGTDPDRLAEEKRRGITIDLGFADLPLDDHRTVSFVDVPGHERFVRHMVAGATGLDAVVLVIAADEGVKPQTREHLEICGLLEIRQGIVALSKADLTPPDLLEVVHLEVREALAGSCLESAPIVAVSARTGLGLEDLRRELGALFDRVPPRSSGGAARLPVDRSFVLRGFGTVVTGTMTAGTLAEGDEVEILPGGRRARIRGLQVHKERVREVRAGQRAAVNLQGVSTDEAPRGATLARPNSLPVSRRFWASVRILPGAPDDLVGKGGRARFHQGTCERTARIRTLSKGSDGGFDVEIVLDREAVLVPGDRFVLRRPAPLHTVGGGVVRDLDPPRIRRRARIDLGRTGDTATLIGVRAERAGIAGLPVEALGRELGARDDEIRDAVAALEREGRVVVRQGAVLSKSAWHDIGGRLLVALSDFHRREPIRDGMSRGDLRRAVAPEMPLDLWRALLDELGGAGRIDLLGERVACAGHRVVLSGRDREIADALEGTFRKAGLEPPDEEVVTRELGGERAAKILDHLVSSGRLVRIRDGRPFHREALEGLDARLREFAKTSRRIDVGAFKDLARVTRKNAIPLLEHLDAERKTRRAGNVREILLD